MSRFDQALARCAARISATHDRLAPIYAACRPDPDKAIGPTAEQIDEMRRISQAPAVQIIITITKDSK